jgi:hypothetical protein
MESSEKIDRLAGKILAAHFKNNKTFVQLRWDLFNSLDSRLQGNDKANELFGLETSSWNPTPVWH